MSLLFMEGFESLGTTSSTEAQVVAAMANRYPDSYYKATAANAALIDNDLADGGLALVWASTSYLDPDFIKICVADQVANTLTVGMRIKTSSGTHSVFPMISFFSSSDAGGDLCQLTLTNSTDLRFQQKNDTTVLLGSGLTASTWHYIEMQVTFHNTTGTAKVYRDDSLIYEGTNLNTLGTAANQTDVVVVRLCPGLQVGATKAAIDDIYLLNNLGSRNNAKLGKDVRIKYFLPDEDSSISDFTKSSEADTRHDHVNNVPADDTKYLTSSTVGHKQLFGMAAVGSGTIAAAQMQSYVTPVTPGTVAAFRNIVKSGSTTVNGTSRYEVHPTVLEVYREDIFETDPNTTAGWSTTGLNSAEFGLEVL
jgi:hypothetical protein